MSALMKRGALTTLLLLLPLLFVLESARVAFNSDVAFVSCRLDARGAVSYLAALHPLCPMRPYEQVSALVKDGRVSSLGGRAELEAFGGGARIEGGRGGHPRRPSGHP